MKSKPETSFTSADSLPAKLLKDYTVPQSIATKGVIPPVHAQFIPTNACNMTCDFCSCSEVDRKQQLTLEQSTEIADKLKSLGTKAVTITGGGEPLMHPQINEIIAAFGQNGISTGMVTNGLLLDRLKDGGKYLTWVRISNGDKRNLGGAYERKLNYVTGQFPNIDWAFSHVVSAEPNYSEIARVVKYANANMFTHVRLVADLFQPDQVPMDMVRVYLKGLQIPTDNVIFQARDTPRPGGDCYIGCLKPLIGADGKVYACCGVQYALETPSKSLPPELCLGDVKDLDKIIANSKTPLDGSICKRCYYTDYNRVLGAMVRDVKHGEFL